MREVQRFLLKLVEEIDIICRNNDIEYYIYAGSMLGVERNEGFLPWDDDMDIVMTRKHYEKFRAIIGEQLPPNRVFEERELHEEYPVTFGKYVSTDTTNIIRSLAYGDCAAGLWIDVMYMAPMPRDEKKRRWVRNIFPVYFDLYNDLYIGYEYRGEGFYRRYRTAKLLSRIFGKQRVLGHIKKKLDNIPEEGCDDYYLFHALDADFRLFSADCFGKPKRTRYENIELNVSPQNRKLCRQAYGDGWMMVPDVDGQETHSTITDCNMPFDIYKKDFMQFLDSKTTLDEYNETKEAHIKWHGRKKYLVDSLLIPESELKALETDSAVSQYCKSVFELVKEKRYKEIGELFGGYIEFQWSSRIKNNGIFVPINDENLFGVLIYLIAERQEFYSANKLLNLRKANRSNVPEYFGEIEELIEQLKLLSISLWDEEDYDKVFDICNSNRALHVKYSVKDFSHALCISGFETGKTEKNEIARMCRELIDNGDESGVPEKILGDINKAKGDFEEALKYLEIACSKLRNGLLLLEASKAIRGISDNGR